MTPLSGKNILIISPEPWGTSRVSKHHYASELAGMNNCVVFLASDGDQYSLRKTEVTNLYKATYKPFIKGSAYLPKVIRRKLQRKKIAKIRKLFGQSFDVIWSFDSSVFYDLDFDDIPVRICHLVDYNQNFHLDKMAAGATHCFGISMPVVQRLRQYNSATFKITHGLNLRGIDAKPKELPGENDIKALYLGNLSIPLIDWDTIKEAVDINSQADFIFVGPENDSNLGYGDRNDCKESLRTRNNVYFLPAVPYQEIHAVLAGADILIIAYKQDDPIQVANPHKVLEYLASGNVVVATYTGEYAHLDDLIIMTRDNRDFPGTLKQTVTQLAHYNSYERKNKRREYAMSQTYQSKIREIESILGND
jgi:glycosyltransferase involved in cell wall biosynthesis